AAFAARTWVAVDSAARTIMSSNFSRLSPPAFAMMSIPFVARSMQHRAPCNKRAKAILLRYLGRICLNLRASLRYLPPPGRVNHEDANRLAAAHISNAHKRARQAHTS